MKKRFISIIFCVLVFIFFGQMNVLAASSILLSQQSLIVDGKMTAGEVYNVGGSNFINLRDLAYVLNGTESQFSVNWDSKTNTVIIQTGEGYESNGSELKSSNTNILSADVMSGNTILIDGYTQQSGYNINGCNYVKLQDLCLLLGFALDYNASKNAVIMTSMTSVHVSNATELLNAIAPNKKVVLSPGTYNLSLVNISSVINEYIQWHTVNDGSEVIIKSVKNCIISGSTNAESTIIVVDSQYANVLSFSNCSYIKLANLTIGHTKDSDNCPGIDLKFSDTQNVALFSCEAFGNGPLRLITDGSSNFISK